MRKWISIITLFIVVVIVAVLRFASPEPQTVLPEPVAYQDIVDRNAAPVAKPVGQNTNVAIAPKPKPSEQPGATAGEEPKPTEALPETSLASEPINLKVPFQTQAPFGIWELPYKEACEEASAIMVDYYIKGKALTPDIMDAEILKFVQWQTDHGYAIDVSALELKDIVEDYYGYKAMIIVEPTVQSIMEQVRAGHPVIIPVRGQDIGNPYFTQPGPPYHMLVIKGMTADGRFITNDPGTKRGQDYLYDTDVLLGAVADWSGSSSGFPEGPKRALVIYK